MDKKYVVTITNEYPDEKRELVSGNWTTDQPVVLVGYDAVSQVIQSWRENSPENVKNLHIYELSEIKRL